MIYNAILNPGILTIVYPISIFGYALLEETRPKKQYWYFIMLYTQVLMITEFVLTFDFWHRNNDSLFEAIREWSMRYYIGLQVVNGN